MKQILLIASVIVLAAAARAEIVTAQRVGNNGVVKGAVKFAGYGNVASNKVCVTADGQTLRTTIAAETQNVCVDSYVDRSDSEHPVTKCRSYQTVNQPARTLETPVTKTVQGCAVGHVDHSDSMHPKTVCERAGAVSVTQDLTYEVVTYHYDDPRHEQHPLSDEKFSVATCK